MPDAGGLVIATDHEDARAYAGQLKRITGESPTVILSDDAKASDKIDEFTASEKRWMVAVRMVSEGVDVPRLSVGVYATSTSTPLFFAQAVGRFVRARRRGETASVFLPSVPNLLGFASEMELERDHVLGRTAAPEGDLFQRIHQHAEGELIADPAWGGVERHAILFVDILMVRSMYDDDQIRAMFVAIADALVEQGVRRDDVFISVSANGGSDWYAGA